MRYIKAGLFNDRKGRQVGLAVKVQTPGGKLTQEPSIGQILWFLLDAYEPTQELRLSPSDMKNHVWPVLDVLEKEPNSKGYYVFENAPFTSLRKVVMFYAERLAGLRLVQHLPIIEAWFDEAGHNDDPTADEPLTEEERKIAEKGGKR